MGSSGSGPWGAAGERREIGRPIAADGQLPGARYGAATARLRRAVAAVRSAAMDFRVLGTIEVAGPLARPVAARREGARDPRAAAARRRAAPCRPTRCSRRAGTACRATPRRARCAVRVANLRAFLEPGPRPRRAVLAARPRRPGLPARDRARPGRRAPLRAQRARGGRARARRRAGGCSTAALALWRGTPFGDLADAELAQPEVRRLEDLRSQAEEARARALVELGRPLEAVAELRRLVGGRPAARGARRAR